MTAAPQANAKRMPDAVRRAMLEHYDEAKDVRRGRVVAKLAELVGETRGK